MTKYVEVKNHKESEGDLAVCVVTVSGKNYTLPPDGSVKFAMPHDTDSIRIEVVDPDKRDDVLPAPKEDWANVA